MASPAEISKFDSAIRSARLIVEWLPDVAERWDNWSEDEQADFTLEWMGLMDHLFYPSEQVEAGTAAPEQVTAFRQIQADLRASAEILQTLELHVPPELLREAAVPPAGYAPG